MRDVFTKMRDCGKESKMRDFPLGCVMVDTYDNSTLFQIRKWRRKTGDGEEETDTKPRRAPFIFYSRKQMSRDRKRQPAERVFTPQMDSVATSKLMREMWHELSEAKKAK